MNPSALGGREHPWKLGILISLFCFALLLDTAGSIGVTWDEPIYSEAAEQAAAWLGVVVRGDLQGAWDPYAFGIGWGLVHEHPPLMRVLSGLGWTLTRGWLAPPVSFRVGPILLAAVAVGVMVAATTRKRGVRAGLFAGAALLTMPRVFYHAHLNALDFPLAAVWMLATLGFYWAIRRGRWWGPLVIGLGLGLALLTKINAVLLLPFWGVWLLGYRRSWRSVGALAAGGVLSVVVLVAGWPWIWKDPVAGLVGWVQFFGDHFGIRQWFAGQLYAQTPWYLPVAMVAITTPALLLVLALIGVVAPASGQVDDQPRSTARRFPRVWRSDWTGLHLFGLLAVLGYYMLPITSVHDQERLLLPAFLHLAILAGDGFAWLMDLIGAPIEKMIDAPAVKEPAPPSDDDLPARPVRVARFHSTALRTKSSRRHILSAAFAFLLLFPGVFGIIRLHPFELSYYNELVGGVRGAQKLGLETTYFASTYGDFLPELNRLPPGSKLWVMPNSWDVIYFYQLQGLLRDDIIVLRPSGWGSFYDDAGVLSEVGGIDAADYALIDRRLTTFNDTSPENAAQLEWARTRPELARLERAGVLLAALYARQ